MNYIIQFLSDVRLELSKIAWPKFDELVGSIIIVLILVAFFSLYLGLIDFVFYNLAQQIY